MYRFLVTIFTPLISLFFPTKVLRRERLPEEGGITLCNHYSIIDIALQVTKIFRKEYNILAKAELFKTRIGNWFFTRMGGIKVDRDGIDIKAYKKVISLLKEGKKISVFPEGTRNKSGSKEMLPLKNGAAFFAIKTRSKVTPMLFYRKPRLFRRNYLIIGETFSLEEFYFDKSQDVSERATEVIKQRFSELREELDSLVEGKK